MKLKHYLNRTFLLLLFCGINLVALAQCPMCKAAVESSAEQGMSATASHLNFGILYIFVIPYITFAVVGILWYRGYKKKKLTAEAAGEISDVD